MLQSKASMISPLCFSPCSHWQTCYHHGRLRGHREAAVVGGRDSSRWGPRTFLPGPHMTYGVYHWFQPQVEILTDIGTLREYFEYGIGGVSQHITLSSGIEQKHHTYNIEYIIYIYIIYISSIILGASSSSRIENENHTWNVIIRNWTSNHTWNSLDHLLNPLRISDSKKAHRI